jgi:hypothetical protein
MKRLKQFLWFVGLLALCTSASAEPVTAAWTAFSAWASSASIPTILSAVGSVVTVAGALDSAASAKDNARNQAAQYEMSAQGADSQAEQLDQQAGQQRASAQRAAQEQRRRATIAASDIQARTGGGSTDSSVLGLTGNIAGEGEYNALTSMYEGEEKARGSEGQAGVSRAQAAQYRAGAGAAIARGDSAARAANTNAFSSVLTGASSLYSKFGNGGPSGSDGDGLGQGDRRKIGVY